MRTGQPFYSGGTWERMTPDAVPDSIATSLAHGWGSGPTSALSKYVLGVRSVSPGYKTWLVEPQPGDLTWAKGRVSTPYGPIEVRWEKQGNEFVLLVEVPDGTLGTVGVPVSGSLDTLIVNGQKVKSETTASGTGPGRPGYAYVRDLAPGTYRIVTASCLLTASSNCRLITSSCWAIWGVARTARKRKGLASSFSWAIVGKAGLIANPTRANRKRIFIVSSQRSLGTNRIASGLFCKG